MIENDDEIDDLTHSIEDRTFLLLARQQPIATDLRFLVTVMRVGHELERSADLMVNVAKTTRRLYPHQLDPKFRGIIDRMGTQASNQTRVAIDAFADSDPSWAAALADMDDAMDELTKSLFRHILASDSSDEAAVLLAVQMALVGRHYERIADHAVTIAERVRLHGHRRAPDARVRPTRRTRAGRSQRRLRRSRGPTRGSGARARRRGRPAHGCGGTAGRGAAGAGAGRAARWRNSSIMRPSPKMPCTSQCGATGPR